MIQSIIPTFSLTTLVMPQVKSEERHANFHCIAPQASPFFISHCAMLDIRLGCVRLDFPIVYDFILGENSQHRISLDHVRIPHCVVLFLKKILHCEEFPKIPKSLSQLNTQIYFQVTQGPSLNSPQCRIFGQVRIPHNVGFQVRLKFPTMLNCLLGLLRLDWNSPQGTISGQVRIPHNAEFPVRFTQVRLEFPTMQDFMLGQNSPQC